MGAERVDADVGVAGMDEDLLVLLGPGIEGIAVERGCAAYPVDRALAEDAHGARAIQGARAQAVPTGREYGG